MAGGGGDERRSSGRGVGMRRLLSTKIPVMTPDALAADPYLNRFAAFAALFTASTWVQGQTLLLGTLLAHGTRTVMAALPALVGGHPRRASPTCRRQGLIACDAMFVACDASPR